MERLVNVANESGYVSIWRHNSTARRHHTTSDNAGLSVIMDQHGENGCIIAQKPKNIVSGDAAPPHSPAVSVAVSAPQVWIALPAYLAQLAGRARGYVEAASSANTRLAYASDWKHFAAWCRRQNLSPPLVSRVQFPYTFILVWP